MTRWFRTFVCAGGVLILAGACTTRRPATQDVHAVQVTTPVAVSCVPALLGPAPDYPDSDAALRDSAGISELLRLLAAGRLLRSQRLSEVEPVISACLGP